MQLLPSSRILSRILSPDLKELFPDFIPDLKELFPDFVPDLKELFPDFISGFKGTVTCESLKLSTTPSDGQNPEPEADPNP